MPPRNTLDNVFRFVQLRPRLAVDPEQTVKMKGGTGLVEEMAGGDGADRRELAERFLSQFEARPPGATDFRGGEAAVEFVLAALAGDAIVADELRERLLESGLQDNEALDDSATFLSDTLLALNFAGSLDLPAVPSPSAREQLRWVYCSYALVQAAPDSTLLELSVAALVRRPFAIPWELSHRTDLAPVVPDADDNGRGARHPSVPADIEYALNELVALDTVDKLNVPVPFLIEFDDRGADIGPIGRDGRAIIPYSLNVESLARLSARTRGVLDGLGIDPTSESIDRVISRVETVPVAEVYGYPKRGDRDDRHGGGPDREDNGEWKAYVHEAGVADLLVVKQHVKGYEAVEIAHVENVMAGETRSRTHRLFRRSEETLFTETERTVEEESELESTDRFELNRESERTLKKDRKLGFELSLSGKYGPTVEFSSNLSMEASQSLEESSKSASSFAQEVVERSLQRISERVKESRTLTLIRESEETNLHKFKNDSAKAEHVVGIYQFLEKEMEAQVFNYGIRQMFDFMVPEPASFVWYVNSVPNQGIQLPSPPVPLSGVLTGWQAVSPWNYKRLQIQYGADEIGPPPSFYQVVTLSVNEGTGAGSESGQPRSFKHTDVEIPEGYTPKRAKVTAQAFTDEHPELIIQVGQNQGRLDFTSAFRHDLGNGKKIGRRSLYFNGPLVLGQLVPNSGLGIDIYAWETATYSAQFDITCERESSHYQNWQKAAFKALADAYDARMREFELRVEELEAEARSRSSYEQDFGDSPSAHLKLILNELKRQCISIVTRQWFDDFNATNDDEPPTFDFDEALEEGSFVRFFEQAFEWEQLQYVFYPYYWARKDTWVDRFLRSESDVVFQDFLQAGAARVVVPVRPGFELAVNHYIETGAIWNGKGDPPKIGSPTYVSIVEEIMERTGAPQGEYPVGDAWEVRLPTSLVLLKASRELPAWVRDAPETWTWTADGNGDGNGGGG